MKFLLLLITLFPSVVWAQVEIPCLKFERNRWRVQKNTVCAQYTKAEVAENNKRLIKLRYFIQVYAPKRKEEIAAMARVRDLWKSTSKTCHTQLDNQKSIALQFKGMADNWQKGYLTLKKLKVPKQSWTQKPSLWFGLGVTAAVVVVIASVAVYNAIKAPTVTVSAKPLRYIPALQAVRIYRPKVPVLRSSRIIFLQAR